MYAAQSLSSVAQRLSIVYAARIDPATVGGPPAVVRGAVGLFLVRDDGADGGALAREVVASFQYWDARTGHQFDGIFLGWGYDQGPVYGDHAFLTCVSDLEQLLNWQYNGRAQLLLVDFVYDPSERQGYLDFSTTIPIDLSKLLDEGKYAQLSPLIEEILRPLHDPAASDGRSPTWHVSDYIVVLRTRRFVWQELIKKLGSILGWADDAANFAVRDLRRNR